jgi:hypothetical protein
MKVLHVIGFWLSLALGLLIIIQVPIIKFQTAKAVEVIEGHYLRQDLTNQDLSGYQSAKRNILWNDNQLRQRLASARHLGLGVCLVLFIQSVAGLVRENKRKGAEPGAPPNGGPAERLARSGARGGPPSVS